MQTDRAFNEFNKSSNINEIIKAVLNFVFFFFFLRKDFARTKSTKKHKKH